MLTEKQKRVMKPKGKWAIKHTRCTRCGRKKYPHHAHGLCHPCFQVASRHRLKNFKKLGRISLQKVAEFVSVRKLRT